MVQFQPTDNTQLASQNSPPGTPRILNIQESVACIYRWSDSPANPPVSREALTGSALYIRLNKFPDYKSEPFSTRSEYSPLSVRDGYRINSFGSTPVASSSEAIYVSIKARASFLVQSFLPGRCRKNSWQYLTKMSVRSIDSDEYL